MSSSYSAAFLLIPSFTQNQSSNNMENHFNDTSSSPNVEFEQKCIIILGTIIAIVACLLNSIALIIFIRYKSSSVNSGIRFLTMIEVFLTVSRVVSDSLLLANRKVLFSYMFTVTSIFLCLRNWWIAVITICRCIAILKPLKANRMFTPKRQVLTLFVVLCSSVALNGLRQVWFFGYQSSAFNIPVFVFQVGLPVPIVVITSASMVIYLASTSTSNMPQTMRNVRRASQTVFQLAAVFTILQSPGLIHTIVTSLQMKPKTLWNGVCNLLSVTDSSANFVIFLINSHNFKRGLFSLFGYTIPNSMTTYYERSQAPRSGRINSFGATSDILPLQAAAKIKGSSLPLNNGTSRYLDPKNIVYHFPSNQFESNSSIHIECDDRPL